MPSFIPFPVTQKETLIQQRGGEGLSLPFRNQIGLLQIACCVTKQAISYRYARLFKLVTKIIYGYFCLLVCSLHTFAFFSGKRSVSSAIPLSGFYQLLPVYPGLSPACPGSFLIIYTDESGILLRFVRNFWSFPGLSLLLVNPFFGWIRNSSLFRP